MSRPLRIEYPGAWHHVMNRGRRRERVFEEEVDYLSFIALLREASQLWEAGVSAYCLMPNHYHLLIPHPFGKPVPVHAPHQRSLYPALQQGSRV